MHYLEVVGGQRITAPGSEQGMRLPQDPAYTPGRAVTGTPKPTKLLSWDFINVLVSSYPRSRMNAQAGSPTDELLIFLCHLRTNWPKAQTESKKLNDMTTVLNSKWNIGPRTFCTSLLHVFTHSWQHDERTHSIGERILAKPLLKDHSRDSKWISCMLHSCVQFQISLVIGGHRISAASAKMVSSGWSSNSQRLRFGALARWNAVTCDISQDRGIDTASFAANGKVFFMCLHTAGNMTGGHTASANEFSQNPDWKITQEIHVDILHVTLMCSVPNFTGDRGA